jgi:hypothetical protein
MSAIRELSNSQEERWAMQIDIAKGKLTQKVFEASDEVNHDLASFKTTRFL